MNTLKTLLAVSIFAAATAANALTVDVTNGTNLNGSITIDADLEGGSETLGQLFQFSLRDFLLNQSWNGIVLNGTEGTMFSGLDPIFDTDGETQIGFHVTYTWGAQTPNSNAASTGSSSNWDYAILQVDVDGGFNPTAIYFEAREYFGEGENDFTKVIDTPLTIGTTPEVPVPAAAWLFGSGLVGLAGAARRRFKAA